LVRLFSALFLASTVFAADPWTSADIYAFRDVSEVRIHPEGSTIVWVEQFADRKSDTSCSNIWLLSLNDRVPRQLTTGVYHDRNPRYSPDGRQFAFLSDRNDFIQIWTRNFIEGRARQLTRVDSPPLAFAWSPDSTAIAYTARLAAEPPRAPWAPSDVLGMLHVAQPRAGLFVAPISGATPVRIPTGNLDILGEPAWMPDGQSILISAAEPGADPEIYAIRLNLSGARALTRHAGPDYSPLPSPDGSRIAWIARDRKPQSFITAKLYVANADGSRVKTLAGSFDRDVTHIQWSSDSRNLYFLAEDRGASHIYAARADGNVRQVTTARERLTDFALADNGRAAAVRSPAEIVTFPVDLPGAPVSLAAIDGSLLAQRSTSAREEIHFTAAGKSMQGWIVKPPAFDPKRRYPLVLDVQDAPRRMCGVEFNLRAQILAARGFVVLCANPRGTPGFGEEFANLLATRNPGDDFDDLMRAADSLAEQPYIDPTRIHLIGGLLAAVANGETERFRSIVAIDPVVVIPERPRLSPILSAESFRTPTLVIDTAFSADSRQLYDVLQARHVESALLPLPEPSTPSRKVAMMDAIAAWLARE
jgi:dipeptidyl aminopeptidase/acylaminoacyl peptidase